MSDPTGSEGWKVLAEEAWRISGFAMLTGQYGTAVGCAILTDRGVVTGFNVQHPSGHYIHAEMMAISNCLSSGVSEYTAMMLCATRRNRRPEEPEGTKLERVSFFPCGSCLDWLRHLAPQMMIRYSSEPGKYMTKTHFPLTLLPHPPGEVATEVLPNMTSIQNGFARLEELGNQGVTS